jgi:hypothetical protein
MKKTKPNKKFWIAVLIFTLGFFVGRGLYSVFGHDRMEQQDSVHRIDIHPDFLRTLTYF